MRSIKGINGCGKAYHILNLLLKENFLMCVVKDEEIDELIDDLHSIENFFIRTEKIKEKFLKIRGFPKSDLEKRIPTLDALKNKKLNCIVTSEESVKKNTTKRDKFNTLTLYSRKNFKYQNLIRFLSETGYNKVDFVEDKGQFAIRGEIVDLWSWQENSPVRVIFHQNKIEAIRTFEVFSQRTERAIPSVTILPGGEDIGGNIFEYIPPGGVLWCENEPIEFPVEIFKEIFVADEKIEGHSEDLGFKSSNSYFGNINLFLKDLKSWMEGGLHIAVCCSTAGEKERFLELMYDADEIPPDVIVSRLSRGGISYKEKVALITYDEILSRYYVSPRLPRFKVGRKLEGLWEISKGDFVVHEDYGIGKYKGLNKIAIGNILSEYITLEYKGGDRVYVPIIYFHKIQKYVGLDDKRPKISSLNSSLWERIKLKARKSISKIARELFELYSSRKNTYRKPFKEDLLLERAVEETFIYEETKDQLKAISDVKKDMMRCYPMDRLVLGDVGFGKTEVALRAAVRCVANGKQVAFICPTTVLAVQHYRTFSDRLSPLPINVRLLSRFQSKAEQKKIIEDLYDGVVDIVIGTHRILQSDVGFKSLGLLIVDDEHKFGVNAKEKLKIMKKEVDTLALTATPIPRTLSMALSGIKDISLIETPPEGRLPIETYVSPYDEGVVKYSILREVDRGGQVFYLYNDISGIEAKKERLEMLLPSVRFSIIHGKMKNFEIEEVMWDFLNRKIDCLISTTIIEAGIDIPNVNTMIIESVENFGLAQIYQLRGRIGRSFRKAYCYLFYSPWSLTESQKKRIEAIKEFTSLGSGFRLALRDLEIRGAGEVLGLRQHGFISNIGLHLFNKMLNEEVKILSERGSELKWEPEIGISIDAYIPPEYLPWEDLRIYFYRKLLSADNIESIDKISEELSDRFGELPRPVRNLLDLAKFRVILKSLGIRKIEQRGRDCFLEVESDGLKKLSEVFEVESSGRFVRLRLGSPVSEFLRCFT